MIRNEVLSISAPIAYRPGAVTSIAATDVFGSGMCAFNLAQVSKSNEEKHMPAALHYCRVYKPHSNSATQSLIPIPHPYKEFLASSAKW